MREKENKPIFRRGLVTCQQRGGEGRFIRETRSPCFIFNGLPQTVWHYRAVPSLLIKSLQHNEAEEIQTETQNPSVHLLHCIWPDFPFFPPPGRRMRFCGESELESELESERRRGERKQSRCGRGKTAECS